MPDRRRKLSLIDSFVIQIVIIFAIMFGNQGVYAMSSVLGSKNMYRLQNRVFQITTTTTTNKNYKSNGGRWMSYRRTIPTMMPEGPEVRTLVDQLQPAVGMKLEKLEFLSGRYIRHGPPAGYQEFIHSLPLTVKEWNAKGKFIYMLLQNDNNDEEEEEDERSVWITLGMSGQFINEKEEERRRSTGYYEKRVGPRWYLQLYNDNEEQEEEEDPTTTKKKRIKIFYQDARNFGTLKFCISQKELNDKLSSLGPDLLDTTNFSSNDFQTIVRKTQTRSPQMNICKFLMNQNKLCGVGNYILAEGLYRANIDPFITISDVTDDQLNNLFMELRETALDSYKAQGLSAYTHKNVDGKEGKFEFQLQCYGRTKCAQRGDPVIKEINGPHGRTIWYTQSQLTSSSSPQQVSTTTTTAAAAAGSLKEEEEDSSLSLMDSLQDSSWKDALETILSTDEFEKLSFFVREERQQYTVYPNQKNVFAALNSCPLSSVKVVIVGQDPYHGPGQAHGLSFSVLPGVPIPPSLRNIFQELSDQYPMPSLPTNGNLQGWANQGVLLLNTVLTVRKGKAHSHAKVGWEDVTDTILKKVNDECDHVVFLLWGKPAARTASLIDTQKHTILTSSHPSPLSARKTSTPFFGSNCFHLCNEALRSNNQSPIDWTQTN